MKNQKVIKNKVGGERRGREGVQVALAVVSIGCSSVVHSHGGGGHVKGRKRTANRQDESRFNNGSTAN